MPPSYARRSSGGRASPESASRRRRLPMESIGARLRRSSHRGGGDRSSTSPRSASSARFQLVSGGRLVGQQRSPSGWPVVHAASAGRRRWGTRLSSFMKRSWGIVAQPEGRIRRPVAKGSRVPACPVLRARPRADSGDDREGGRARRLVGEDHAGRLSSFGTGTTSRRPRRGRERVSPPFWVGLSAADPGTAEPTSSSRASNLRMRFAPGVNPCRPPSVGVRGACIACPRIMARRPTSACPWRVRTRANTRAVRSSGRT